MGVIALVVIIGPFAALAATAPTITAAPASGQAGTTVQVSGSGFVAATRGRILWDGSATGMPTFKVRSDGTFSVNVSVPTSATAGTHTLAAKMTSGSQKGFVVATTRFTVIVASPSPTIMATPVPPTPVATPIETPLNTPVPTPDPTTPPTPDPTPDPTPQATPSPPPSGAPLAFPGAVGYGSGTPGGRGGAVYYVTTLADDGPGSLRAALEASGPRTVLFQVSGVITLASSIRITSPYLTLAGQTAPGQGVVVRGEMVRILTHDVVIRYMRFRTGDATTTNPADADGLTIHAPTEPIGNIILDHVGMIWGPDMGGLAVLEAVSNLTVQNSIMGEGLKLSRHPEGTVENGGHAYATNVSPLTGGTGYASRLTFYRNLFTDADKRMPAIRSAECVDLVNNVIYDWGTQAVAGNPRSLNIINNWFRWGPIGSTRALFKSQTVTADPVVYPDAVYLDGNLADGFNPATLTGSVFATSLRCGGLSVAAETPDAAWAAVVAGAGATLPARDEVDRRIIDELLARTGGTFNGDGQPAPNPYWPDPATGPASLDADLDGMPDDWEVPMFGDLTRDGRVDRDGDGYTDLEEYLNGTTP